jgi:hypothetical protein
VLQHVPVNDVPYKVQLLDTPMQSPLPSHARSIRASARSVF